MDTNGVNTTVLASEGMKNVTEKRKTLAPAILGIPNSHGVKFSVNMTSEDKKELLTKLEEWRKVRKEKLAASILAKQKQTEKPKASVPHIPLKIKPVSIGGNGSSKLQDRLSVFERLYQNNGKIKKPEIIVGYNKQQQVRDTNCKKSAFLPLDKSKKSEKSILTEKNHIKISQATSKLITQEPLSFVKVSEKNCDLNPLNNISETDGRRTENCSVGVTQEKLKEGVELAKPIQLIGEQGKMPDAKSFKNGPAFKSLPIKANAADKGKPYLRRSISMVFRQRCRAESTVRRSFSAKSLHEINLNKQRTDQGNFPTLQKLDNGAKKETKNEVAVKSVMLATPKNIKLLTPTHLRMKLEDWLKVKGHSLEGYRHLRCFGISGNTKPFTEASSVALDDSFEKSYYATAPNTPDSDLDKENVTPPTVIQQADVKEVENWLEELHRLIVELKYPPERCEEWLAAIRKKYMSCSQLPIYWECLAALHESKGDLKSAIEDYERAIIKGGEVDTVGESLAQLFDKMVIERKNCGKSKLEKGIDPKNIFKSTIIKFALQQKAIKKLSSEIEPGVRQQLYIATPVRRSTRLQTPFKSSDEIPSLQTLTPEFRKNVTFKPNESLLSRD